MGQIDFMIGPSVTNEQLNALFRAAWPQHADWDFQSVLTHSLGYVCALAASRLIGFVNVASDGGSHAFLLDPTVHPEYQRQGIGTDLLQRATKIAKVHGAEWLHVDYDEPLEGFDSKCGFRSTAAGLIRLSGTDVGQRGNAASNP